MRRPRCGLRESHDEAASAPLEGSQVNAAAKVGGDQGSADRQAKARAIALDTGGEKRLEDTIV